MSHRLGRERGEDRAYTAILPACLATCGALSGGGGKQAIIIFPPSPYDTPRPRHFFSLLKFLPSFTEPPKKRTPFNSSNFPGKCEFSVNIPSFESAAEVQCTLRQFLISFLTAAASDLHTRL